MIEGSDMDMNKMELLLEIEDENRILSILAKNEWVSEDEFMSDNNLSYESNVKILPVVEERKRDY